MSNDYKPKIIEGSEDTPMFLFDIENQKIRIEGSSFPEDANVVYNTVLDWIKTNGKNLDSLLVEFDYKILSSASNKMVYEIMILLEDLYKKGKTIKVKWFYFDYDEDMFTEGKSFKDSFSFPFELIEKKL